MTRQRVFFKKEDIVNLKKQMNRGKTACLFLILILASFPLLSSAESIRLKVEAADGQSLKNPAVIKNLEEAKAKLQAGVNTRKLELFQEARDLFLNCLMQEKPENAYLLYYVALADFRLASSYLIAGNAAESERNIGEGQKYLEKAMALDPQFGEAEALYGYLMGMNLAFHPDQAMTLGMKSLEYLNRAVEKDPNNPRVHFLKGIYQLYVPEDYGGGPDSALQFLEKAVSLFEKESVTDPLKPTWGRDETLTNAAMIYKQKKNEAKAVELLKKALAVNPNYGRAKAELAALEKKDPMRT